MVLLFDCPDRAVHREARDKREGHSVQNDRVGSRRSSGAVVPIAGGELLQRRDRVSLRSSRRGVDVRGRRWRREFECDGRPVGPESAGRSRCRAVGDHRVPGRARV